MMPQLTFVFVGLLAFLVSIGAVARLDAGTRILSAFAAGVLWFLWGASAVELGVRTGASSLQSVSLPMLTYIGYAFAAVLMIVGVYHALTAVRDSDDSQEE